MIARLQQLELMVNDLARSRAAAEGRLAAVEQGQWQRAGPSGPADAGEVALAQVTTTIANAASSTEPGVGEVQRFLTVDVESDPTSLADLTGVDEPCASIDVDKQVAVGATVLIVKVRGAWFVVAVDSCANLTGP